MKPSSVLLILLCLCSHAAAQDRVGVGGAITYIRPASDELTSAPVRVTPIVRLQPGEGWGVAAALNWLDTDVDGAFAGIPGDLGRLEIKPLMGGVGYTLRSGRVRTTFSVVAGPAWSRLKIREEVRNAFRAFDREIDDTLDAVSVAVRPGAGVSIRIAPRLDLTGFAGYLFNRPEFEVPTFNGDVTNDWNTDGVVLSVGVVFAVF